MINRFAMLAAACMLVPVGTAPLALADEPAPPVVPAGNAGAPPPGGPGGPGPAGPVPSAPAGVLKTPDGYTLTVQGQNESMEPVAALTGAPTSREYLVDGTFTGSVTGSGGPKLAGGNLEAGYQIGCGIAQDDIENIISAGITPSVGIPLVSGTILPITIQPALSYQMKIVLKPGTVNIVPVDKKTFKGTSPKINVTGLRVKFDQCAGSSFIRSFATLTSSTDDTDDVVTYVGVTKMV
ncbi:MspA family porin [Mycobacterium sp. 1274761.0]|uniref:MspA family porin n=1 Tax=Mycobacterium sp. 1274761.0 TaxID=1834077 RepID=UPI000800C8F3|nr:MspA protein [Mycobacterium sp. 1274761.0]